MKFRSRLAKVTKMLNAERPGGPLTVVLNEATVGRPPGRCERVNSAGLPVVEITFDPVAGPVELPAPPYKLVAGTDPVDLV
jgi:hypothetical protein